MMKDKWHLRFIQLADLYASWSKDPSTQVGAVIVYPNTKQIVSGGFNGFPPGMDDTPERFGDNEFKQKHVLHAEDNAIYFAGGADLSNTILYSTHPPCESCLSKIQRAQIPAVIYGNNISEHFYQKRKDWIDNNMEFISKEMGISIYSINDMV